MKTLKILLVCALLAVGCKKDPPSPPGKVSLLSPAKNSECSPIDSDSGNTNLVQFSWQVAPNTESYLLEVNELNSGTTQVKTTTALSEILAIEKGTPFSWKVTAKNTAVTETSVSETWFFFSPGTESSYAPFPAEVFSPIGPKAFIDVNGDLTLEWAGADLDEDIDGYELYFGAEDPPALHSSLNASQTSVKISAVTQTIYYWRVVTIDAEGNTSDTGIMSFEAI
ncbi:hypothetical protein N9954_08180 [Maribacter sp.]|nr:hypothetical protein [Maribacter sp.]